MGPQLDRLNLGNSFMHDMVIQEHGHQQLNGLQHLFSYDATVDSMLGKGFETIIPTSRTIVFSVLAEQNPNRLPGRINLSC